MKIKNIKVGDYIESKNIHGDDKVYPILKTGEKYKVLEIDEDMHELPIMIAVPGHKIFGDGFWVHPKNFRKPKLKVLDQSIFDGLDEKWRFAAVDGEKGVPTVFDSMPVKSTAYNFYSNTEDGDYRDLIHLTGYDASNWQNSLIEREREELTGSDLCRAMLARGDKFVMCSFSDDSDKVASLGANEGVCVGWCAEFRTYNTYRMEWKYAVPINNMGEPLTAKEAGL